ncbi:DUF6526 family protein [Paenibacillus campi]|uniref:DUF6526 family protein n=1 Tax=Paenibacillus campi TaxID=3106031 RepID=UPI002AFEA0FE|nr:DUF6526 family protein [Paenibacillus sp. SGZ-1014]
MAAPNKKSIRFDWPYHFVALPLLLITLVLTISYWIDALRSGEHTLLAWLLLVLLLCLCFAIPRIRVYATKTQDRIVRMEEQFRYYRLTGQEIDPRLTREQIITLRNASDAEFPALCERAANEQLSGKQIHETIVNWRKDEMRI